MNRILLAALAGAVAGGGLVAALLWPGRASEAPLPQQPAAAAPAAPRAAAPAPAAPAPAELAPIAARIDQVLDRLIALEAKVDTALAAPQRSAAAPAPAPAAVVDADALQQALAEVDRRKFEALPDGELRQLVWKAMQGGSGDEGLRALEVLRGRARTPDERAQVLLELGMLQRERGDEAGLLESARSLQAVIDEQGIDSARGLEAAYQMAWTVSRGNNPAAGLRWAEAVARSPNATPGQRINARRAGAIIVQKLGHTGRARAEFQALLREIEGQPSHEKLAAELRARLAELEGK
ncbi:MAG: hypothetical protein FJ265_03490 [Planctomycetes bacterium]|nr:hypothetical protein [Planctomycetota bacterium]